MIQPPVVRTRRAASHEVEKAAMRWLERYLSESSPSLAHSASVTNELAGRLD